MSLQQCLPTEFILTPRYYPIVFEQAKDYLDAGEATQTCLPFLKALGVLWATWVRLCGKLEQSVMHPLSMEKEYGSD